MANERVAVLQPDTLAQWSLPAANYAGFDNGDCIGRFLKAASPPVLHCTQPVLLERQSEAAFFFPRGGGDAVRDFPLDSVRLDSVPGANLVGDKFVVVSRDRRVFRECYWNPENLNDRRHFQTCSIPMTGPEGRTTLPVVLWREPARRGHVEGTALLLGNPWSFNYYHWLIESLLRLWWTEAIPELAQVPVIVPASLSAFQQASLSALVDDERRLLRFGGGVWRVDRLLVATSSGFWPVPLAWLRRRVLEHLGLADGRPAERLLYISRADAESRRVTNEAELAEHLASRGFEILRLGELPWAEQVRMFSEARLVIGAHGAGLVNVIFSPRQTTLVDLHPADQVNHALWVLASALGQRYVLVTGKVANAQRDFYVALPDVDALLGRVL